MGEKLWTIREILDKTHINLSRATLYRMVEDGQLPCKRYRGTIRIPQSEVLKLAGIENVEIPETLENDEAPKLP